MNTAFGATHELKVYTMSTLTNHIARYIVDTGIEAWSAQAVDKAKIHIFDTLLAMVSGRHLIAGRKALEFQAAHGRSLSSGARILGTEFHSPPEIAAMVNGMFAHADETDDTSEAARMHPGASIVPAAFAIADQYGASGEDFLAAVLVGYQVGVAFPQAVWAEAHDRMHSARATHNVGQIMGAVATAGRLLRLDAEQMGYALSYAAQQTSGVNSLYRERQHVEKAYVFGGMPAEQGVRAAIFAALGFTGVTDVFDTGINFFDSFEGRSDPAILKRELANPEGGVFQSDIKLYPVGLPIQAAAQAMDEILASRQIDAADVSHVTCRLPSQKAYIVDDRDMPPISLQYILATMLEDGGLTFANSHDQGRLDAERGKGLMSRVELIHDDTLNPTDERGSRNRARVTVHFKNAEEAAASVDELKGTRFSPATWMDMTRKAEGVLGAEKKERIAHVMDAVRSLESAEMGKGDDLAILRQV